MTTRQTQHPAQGVGSLEELERMLEEGVRSGAPRPMTESDWEALRKLALAT